MEPFILGSVLRSPAFGPSTACGLGAQTVLKRKNYATGSAVGGACVVLRS